MGNQVKVVVKTPTNYRPPTSNPTPHPSVPFGSGAPTMAPGQTKAVTGDGPATEGAASHPDMPALAPRPATAASTAQIEQGPSVNYDANQETPANIEVAQHRIIAGEQDQQLQDKAGA